MSETLDLDETPSQALVLQPAVPAGPLVVADESFMAKLGDYEALISGFKIADAEQAKTLANAQTFLTKSGTSLESEREKHVKPFLAAQRQINSAVEAVQVRINLAKNTAKQKLGAWNQAQIELAAAAEKKRLAEEADKERIRQAEIARLQKIADEEARVAKERADAIERERLAQEKLLLEQQETARKAAATQDLDLDSIDAPHLPIPGPQPLRPDYDEIFPPEKTEAQKQLDALKYAPAVKAAPIVAPRIQGVSFRSWVEIVSVDVNQLPESLVIKTADTKAIRAAYISGWRDGQPLPVCPGCVFTIKKEPITR